MALSRAVCSLYTGIMIHVLIIDSHNLVRFGLESRLKSAVGLKIVGSTSQYDTALQQARALHPDVILLESKTPDAPATISALCRELPHCAVIVLTSYPDSREEDELMQMGVTRYLLKTLDTKALVSEIRAAARAAARVLQETPG